MKQTLIHLDMSEFSAQDDDLFWALNGLWQNKEDEDPVAARFLSPACTSLTINAIKDSCSCSGGTK